MTCKNVFLGLVLSSLVFAAPVTAQDNPAGKVDLPGRAETKSPGELRASELDRLFGQLQAAEAERAATIEQKIWATWSRADSVTAEVLLSQAGKAMAAEEFEAALQILDELVKARPDFAEAWNRRATLYFRMQRYSQSLADIEKVLELEPRHFGALAGRGMIFLQQDQPDEALAAYREALTMNPHMAGVKDAVKKLEKERPEI